MFAQYELELVNEIVPVDCAAAGVAELERIPPASPPASSKLANIESGPRHFWMNDLSWATIWP
jgi:hypothetical protein